MGVGGSRNAVVVTDAVVGRGRNWHSARRGGDSRWIRLPADVLRVGQLVVLLPLHASVLEPDLYLALG